MNRKGRKAVMKKLDKEFQAITKEFDALAKKTKELTDELKKKATAHLEKARLVIKPGAAARTTAQALKSVSKTLDKVAKALENFEKEQRSKTGAARKPRPKPETAAGEKAKVATDTQKVLRMVTTSDNGVNVAALRKATGIEDKKIRGILARAYKQGKIKRVGKGLYAGA